jgi:hypothetical protein
MPEQQTYLLHDVHIAFEVEDADAARRLAEAWRPFRAAAAARPVEIHVHLRMADEPPAPPDLPAISRGPEVNHYRQGPRLVSLFPTWGRFDIDLAHGRVEGQLAPGTLQAYGVFEDMILMALAPLLRRRGYMPLHAFAAAVGDRALLLLGDTGAGKTTTGLSLLARGARLLSNDAPLLSLRAETPRIFAYPGLISAYPDSITRFPVLAPLLHDGRARHGSGKISFPAERIWPGVWTHQAYPAALLFLHLRRYLTTSQLAPISRTEALQRLIDQNIERWDTEVIPAQLRALRALVEDAPAYELGLAPDIAGLPDRLLALL